MVGGQDMLGIIDVGLREDGAMKSQLVLLILLAC